MSLIEFRDVSERYIKGATPAIESVTCAMEQAGSKLRNEAGY